MVSTTAQEPLQGVKVIDFGHCYAGPLASMLLADQGATVVHIVKQGKKELATPQYDLLNRGKYDLNLDLKCSTSKEVLKSLIADADVLIENFRPGVMARLGLGYMEMRAINPALIYLSLPGFASSDKSRSHIQAWEGVVSAAAGIYTDIHIARQALGFPPVYTALPLCSVYAATYGAMSVMTALLHREQQSGQGTLIEVPLVDAAMSAMAVGIYQLDPKPKAYEMSALPVGAELYSFPTKGNSQSETQVEKSLEQGTRYFMSPLNRFYPCADGRLLFLYSADHKMHTRTILESIGIYHELLSTGFVDEGPWRRGLDNNLTDTEHLRSDLRETLDRLISRELIKNTADYWETKIGEAGAPATVVRTTQEWLAFKPLLDSGVLTKLYSKEGVFTVPGKLVDISNNAIPSINHYQPPQPITLKDAIRLFSSGTDIVADSETTKTSPQKSDLLKNLKVLDFSNAIAGPTAARTLAEFGAEVIKIDPPELYSGPIMVWLAVDVGQGKKSILVDLKTSEGQAVLSRLIRWADVVVHNFLDETAQRIGLGLNQLRRINKNIVSCRVSAFGGTVQGAMGQRTGWDPLIQAASGIVTRYGSLDSPQMHAWASCNDYLCGISAAFGIVVALYQKLQTGYAGDVHTSLARAANFIQLPFMIGTEDNRNWGEPKGQSALGESRLQRLYACSDGWIYVGVATDKADLFISMLTGEEKQTDENVLQEIFRQKSCDYWLTLLQEVGLGCHRVTSLVEIRKSHTRKLENGDSISNIKGPCQLLRSKHPSGADAILTLPSWVRVGQDSSVKCLSHASSFGGDSKEVLRQLNYSEAQISTLLKNQAVYEHLQGVDVFFD